MTIEIADIPTAFCAAVTAKFPGEGVWYPERGRAYTRLVHEYRDTGSRTCYGFIDNATGDLIKSGGWKAPQRDKDGLAVRYRLADPAEYERAVAEADRFGGFLYKR